MGTDIHGFVETTTRGGQVFYVADVKVERDYLLFACLAGVRDSVDCPAKHVPPRGKVPNPDWRTASLYDQWIDDGHSYSWLSLAEVEAAAREYKMLAEPQGMSPQSMGLDVVLGVMRAIDAHGGTSRYVFFFDN